MYEKKLQLRETLLVILSPIVRVPIKTTLKVKPAFKNTNSKLKFIHNY